MIPNGNTRNEKIERFLLSKMGEEELVAFHMELLRDPQLRKEVELMRAVIKTSRSAKVTSPVLRTRNILLMGSLVLLLLFVAFFLISKNGNPAESSTSSAMNQPRENSRLEDNLKMDGGFSGKELRKTLNPGVEDSASLLETVTNPSKKTSGAIKEGSLEPNLYLEQFVNTTFRSTAINLELKQASSELMITENESPIFQIEGTISGTLEQQQLRLTILSNKPADFENAHYLLTEDIPLEKAGASYQFSFRGKLDLESGLYYYLLLFPATEEPAKVGKFIIR